MILQPLDIIAVDGLWYMPHHWPIRQRGQGDRAVHNAIVLSGDGHIENVDFFRGPHVDHMDRFKGCSISIHRYKGNLGPVQCIRLLTWLTRTRSASHGYDFRQLAAAYLGVASDSFRDDETVWTCSERAYWLFQDNVAPLTEIPDVMPHPRLIRYNDHFREIFRGVWKCS